MAADDFDPTPSEDEIKAKLAAFKKQQTEDGLKTKDEESRLAAAFGSGANRGIAGMAGMPVDVANYVLGGGNPLIDLLQSDAARGAYDSILGQDNFLSKLLSTKSTGPLVDKPVMGSQWIRDNVMPTPIEPRTAGETIADSVGNQVGATVTGMIPGGAIKAAAMAPELTSPIVRKAGEALSGVTLRSPAEIAEALATTSPQRLAAVETMLAATAGVGGGVAKVVAPDSPTAELAGQLVTTLGAAGAYEAVRNVKSRMLGSWARYRPSEAEMKAQIGDDILRATERNGVDTNFAGQGPIPADTFERRMADTNAVVGDIPGVDATLGQATASPELIAKEVAYARMPGDFQNSWLLRRRGSEEALNDFFDSIVDTPADGPSIVNTQDSMRRVIDDRAARVANDLRRTVQIDPGTDAESASKALKSAISEAHAEARLQAGKLYDPIPYTIPVKNGGLIKEVIRQVESPPEWTESTDIPSVVRDMYDKFVVPARETAGKNQQFFDALLEGQTMDFGSARNLRTRILRDTKKAARMGEDAQVHFLNRLSDQVHNTLDDVAENVDFPDVAQQYRVANSFYADASDRFKRGLVRDLFGKDKTGDLTIPGEKAFGEFFKPGMQGAVNADKLRQSFVTLGPDGNWAPSPDMNRVVRANVLNSLAGTANVEGKVNLDKLISWHNKYRPFLRRFPEIENEVNNLAGAQRALDNVGLAGQRSIDAMRRSAVVRMIDMDPEAAVSTALSGKSAVSSLRRLVRDVSHDQDAVVGLRKSVLDHIGRETSSTRAGVGDTYDYINPMKLRTFMRKNRGKLEAIYTPEEMANLRKMAHAAEIVGRTERSPFAGSPTTQLKANMDAPNWFTPMKTLVRHMWGSFAAAPVRVPLEAGARMLEAHFRGITEEKMRRLWEEAILDPNGVGQTFVDLARGKSPAKLAREFRAHLAALGAGYEDDRDSIKEPNLTDREIASQTRDTVDPLPPPPAPPAPPPKPPKYPKPIDVSKDLKRGTITPTDVQDLARAGQP